MTGPPGVGKTTLVKRLLERLRGKNLAGFFTEEIRARGGRRGFSLVSLRGGRSTLSHVDFKGPHRVGRYGVDVEGFERFVRGISVEGAEVVIVDEIGRMECISPVFRQWLGGLLSSGRTLVATIGLGGDAFMEGVRKTPGAKTVTLSRANRDAMVEEVLRMLGAASPGPGAS